MRSSGCTGCRVFRIALLSPTLRCWIVGGPGQESDPRKFSGCGWMAEDVQDQLRMTPWDLVQFSTPGLSFWGRSAKATEWCSVMVAKPMVLHSTVLATCLRYILPQWVPSHGTY